MVSFLPVDLYDSRSISPKRGTKAGKKPAENRGITRGVSRQSRALEAGKRPAEKEGKATWQIGAGQIAKQRTDWQPIRLSSIS